MFATGFLDALIPFVIIYSILFIVFKRANIVQDKRINIVLSLSIAALVAFSPAGLPIIQLFRQLFSGTVVLLVFLIIFIAIAFLLSIARSPRPTGSPEPMWLLIVAGIIAFYLLARTDVLRFLGLSIESFPIPPFIFVLLGVAAVIMIILKYTE